MIKQVTTLLFIFGILAICTGALMPQYPFFVQHNGAGEHTAITATSADVESLTVNSSYTFPTGAPSSGNILRYDGSSLGWYAGGPPPRAVMMVRVGDGEFKVYDPDGLEIDISSSTTDGLQEAIDYANDNEYNLYVYGGGASTDGEDHAVITCTTPIDVPVLRLKVFVLDSVTVDFPSSIGANYGFDFDTCILSTFYLNGQIVYAGTGDAVYFDPRTADPVDSVTAIESSMFYIGCVSHSGTAANNKACVRFRPSSGYIQGNVFTFGEIQAGGNTDRGIFVSVSDATSSFLGNIVQISHVSSPVEYGILLGESTLADGKIKGNIWNVGLIQPSDADGVAFSTFGSNDYISFSADDAHGGLDYGLQVQSTADENFCIIRMCDGASSGNYWKSPSAELNRIFDASGTSYIGNDISAYGNISADNLHTDIVTATYGYITALRAAPFQLVPAQGDGTLIEFVSAVLILNAGSEALTESDDNLQIVYDSGNGAAVSEVIEATGFINQTVDTITRAVPIADPIDAAADIVNKNLALKNIGDSEYGGNASEDVTMRVIITYRVHESLGL